MWCRVAGLVGLDSSRVDTYYQVGLCIALGPVGPPADDLVRKVREVLPTVPHATVYRNLQELVREGLIRTLDMAGAAAQFEVNPDEHHHFVGRKCGRVWDVYLSSVEVTGCASTSLAAAVPLRERC